MTITSNNVGEALVLSVAGRLDGVTSPEFQRMCQQYIGSESRRVVMDFGGVEYVSSAGIRVIFEAGKRVRASGGELRLSGLHGTVKNTLEIAGICALFPIYDSIEAALEPI
jgi:anti-anti-sigma factor